MSGQTASVDAQSFRAALGTFASSVTVLTMRGVDGRPLGMTATAFSSLSLDARTIIICVNRSARSRSSIVESGYFGVNILASMNQGLAEHCAKPNADKGLDPDWLDPWSKWKSPALRESLAFLDCVVQREIEADSHSIIIGEVTGIKLAEADSPEPLLFFRGSYRRLQSPVSVA